MEYQVGGSLAIENSTYVERQADTDLYQALLHNEFCYVLTSRQMGKSSLRLRMRHRLEQEQRGLCASIDMTRIGSRNITIQQWYQGIAFDLLRSLKLTRRLDFKTWWLKQGDLSPVQKFSQFIEDVLFTNLPRENIFILIDEIDSVKSLDFSVDDFFALIRFCYNQRAENPVYRRLTWALFGVASPSNLIVDPRRTPFNIGKAIDLPGFSLKEVQPLAQGLVGIVNHPQAVLKEILGWTRGQPFLTQKLCYLVGASSQDSVSGALTIPPGAEAFWVESLVRSRIIDNWEAQDEPEHLRTIRDRLLHDEQRSGLLLGLYQRLLDTAERGRGRKREKGRQSTPIPLAGKSPSPHPPIPPSPYPPSVQSNGSCEPIELLLSGLVVRRQGQLQVNNPIYAAVFNAEWVETQLSKRRPYAEAIRAWVESSYEDESRLLCGKALEEAENWAAGKSLSDLDYQFLTASQELDRREIRMALDAAEKANRLLTQAQNKAKRIIWLGYLSLTMCLILSFGSFVLRWLIEMQTQR